MSRKKRVLWEIEKFTLHWEVWEGLFSKWQLSLEGDLVCKSPESESNFRSWRHWKEACVVRETERGKMRVAEEGWNFKQESCPVKCYRKTEDQEEIPGQIWKRDVLSSKDYFSSTQGRYKDALRHQAQTPELVLIYTCTQEYSGYSGVNIT